MGRGKSFKLKRQDTINRPPKGNKIAREEFSREEPMDLEKHKDSKKRQ